MINIGGVVGLLPITGLPLPFISDGGSALVVTLAAVGMLASFARAEPDAARALHARPPGQLGPATLGPAAAAARSRGRSRRAAAPARHAAPGRRGCPGGRREEREETVMAALRSVVLAGGGTGGHIYPLLAFADCLRRHDPDVRITCLGSPKGLENELIPAAGLRPAAHPGLPAAPLGQPGPGPHPGPDVAVDAGRPRAILDEVEADVVVGFGGYVVGAGLPGRLAAPARPIVIHEVNVPPGVANRLGMRFTKHVAVGFPHQPQQVRRCCATRGWSACRCARRSPRWTGPRCASGPARTSGSTRDRPTLFVFGASQGARSINLAVAGAAKALTAAGVQVLHVIGARNEPVDDPAGPAGAVRDGAVPRRDGARLRRRRPGAVPGRGDDLRRGDRGRAAGRSTCRCRTATASSGATRCRSWRPVAACWSTTPS